MSDDKHTSLDDYILGCKSVLRKAFSAVRKPNSAGLRTKKTPSSSAEDSNGQISNDHAAKDIDSGSLDNSQTLTQQTQESKKEVIVSPEQQQLQIIQQQLSDQKSENESLKSAIDQLQEVLSSERIDKEKSSREQTELKDKLEELENTRKSLRDELESIKSKHNLANQELQSVKQSLQQERESSQSLKQEIETYLTEKQKLQENLKSLNSDHELTQRELDRYQQVLLQNRREYESEKRLSETKISSLEQQLDENHTTSLKETIEQLKTDNLKLLDEKNELLDNSENLSNEIIEMKDRINELKITTSQTLRIRNELKETETLLSHERAEMRNMQTEIEKLQENLFTAEEEKRSLSDKLEHAIEENQKLQSEHEQLVTEFDRFRTQENLEISGLLQELDQLRHQLQESHNVLEQKEQEFQAYQDQASGEINILQENNDLQKNENAALSNEMAQLKEKLQQTESTLEQLTTELESLKIIQDELADERNCTRELRQEYEQIQNELNEVTCKNEHLVISLDKEMSVQLEMKSEIARLSESERLIHLELQKAQDHIHRLEYENDEIKAHIEEVSENTLPVSQEGQLYDPGNRNHEDSVNTTVNDDHIPTFNLADQIMEEHRRSVSVRRQRVQPTSSNLPPKDAVENIVRQYVSAPQPFDTPAKRNNQIGIQNHPWTDYSLSTFQREILQEIVQKDLQLYRRKRSNKEIGYTSLNN